MSSHKRRNYDMHTGEALTQPGYVIAVQYVRDTRSENPPWLVQSCQCYLAVAVRVTGSGKLVSFRRRDPAGANGCGLEEFVDMPGRAKWAFKYFVITEEHQPVARTMFDACTKTDFWESAEELRETLMTLEPLI